jgi:hypothetical protein
MQIDTVANTASGGRGRDQQTSDGSWKQIFWQPTPQISVRAPDQVFEELTAEAHLFQPVVVTGVVRSTQVLDILSIDFPG